MHGHNNDNQEMVEEFDEQQNERKIHEY